MDNAYLRVNVLPALTEALTAMAVQVPEDRVEFVGKYLQSYVARKITTDKKNIDAKNIEADLNRYLAEEKSKTEAAVEARAPVTAQTKAYESFLESISGMQSKQEAMDAVTQFLETTLAIPASYISVRYTSGEVDYLKYISKGDGAWTVKGKKLLKPAADDSEEAPERQGVSFEAFKVPEMPEEEEAPVDEDGEAPPPKGPPPLQPLIITNTMRDKRVKFFGIPKLGSYLAVPLTYTSLEHEAAVTFTPAEGETPAAYSLTPKEAQFLLCCDTIGQYRLFSPQEVVRVSQLGAALASLFSRLEAASAERQMALLTAPDDSNPLVALNAAVTDFAAKIGEIEAAALAASLAPAPTMPEVDPAAAADPPADGEDVPAPVAAVPIEESPEAKTLREATVVLNAWNGTLGGLTEPFIAAFSGYELPLPASATRLLYVICLLKTVTPSTMLDFCKDPSWEVMRSSGLITDLMQIITFYDPTSIVYQTIPEQRLVSIKAYMEANGVADAGAYPSFLPIFASVLLPWLTKAIAAREAALVLNPELEVAQWEGREWSEFFASSEA